MGVGLTAFLLVPTGLTGQGASNLSGTVRDADSGAAVPGAEVQLLGIGVQVTDSAGMFRFPVAPVGESTLRVRHLAYGTHEKQVDVEKPATEVEIRISQTAIELSPIVVEAPQNEQRGAGFHQNRVGRVDLAKFEGTTMDLGDVLSYEVPGVRVRRGTILLGAPFCIEFRGATGGSAVRGGGTTDRGCNSPEVYLDGVLVANPSSLYPTLPIETIESLEVIPPSEAGGRFGTGALWGAIVIESRRPGRPARERGEDAVPEPSMRFDWAQEPNPHARRKVFLSALGANAAGLALGLAVSKQCIGLRDPGFDSIVSDCSGVGTMASAVGAVAIPALSAAAAARWAGDTETSRGRFTAAVVGAAIGLVPGYAFQISSHRDDSAAVGSVGLVMLLVGAPFAVTVADRLFRRLR